MGAFLEKDELPPDLQEKYVDDPNKCDSCRKPLKSEEKLAHWGKWYCRTCADEIVQNRQRMRLSLKPGSIKAINPLTSEMPLEKTDISQTANEPAKK